MRQSTSLSAMILPILFGVLLLSELLPNTNAFPVMSRSHQVLTTTTTTTTSTLRQGLPRMHMPSQSFSNPVRMSSLFHQRSDGIDSGDEKDDPPMDRTGSASQLGPNASPPGILRRSLPHFPWRRVPNWLTYFRCLTIPILPILFYTPNCHIATGRVFALSSFTDWLDGYLARRWDVSTPFGAFLDPVADKLTVSTCLILLAGRYGAVVSLPTAVILAREIAVSALREWMAQRGKRDAVQVGFQGKVKTAVTMVALVVLLYVPHHDAAVGPPGRLFLSGISLLYFCAAITVTSGSVYFRGAASTLLSGD